MRARLLLTLAASVAATALPSPAAACACGVAPQARIDVEHALVSFAGGKEHLVISYDLRAQSAHAAIVLPVPAEPTVTALAGGGNPFAYLERVAVNRTPPSDADGAVGGAAPAGAAPTVKRSTVGGYSVTRLHGGSSGSVTTWLKRNGYALPKGATPIVRQYIARRWWFVALRLAKRQDGALKPLDIAFRTDRPMYPMRLAQLATRPVQLDLYAVTPTTVEVAPLAKTFTGIVSGLAEQPPTPALKRLMPQGATLTKLIADGVDPAEFRTDLWLRAGESAPGRGFLSRLRAYAPSKG